MCQPCSPQGPKEPVRPLAIPTISLRKLRTLSVVYRNPFGDVEAELECPSTWHGLPARDRPRAGSPCHKAARQHEAGTALNNPQINEENYRTKKQSAILCVTLSTRGQLGRQPGPSPAHRFRQTRQRGRYAAGRQSAESAYRGPDRLARGWSLRTARLVAASQF